MPDYLEITEQKVLISPVVAHALITLNIVLPFSHG